MDHTGHVVKQIISLQQEMDDNYSDKHNKAPKRQCNIFLSINLLVSVWAHFEIIWFIFSKLNEDYNWKEITDYNKNGNIRWTNDQQNAIFWQIQMEILILIQWIKGSIENILH